MLNRQTGFGRIGILLVAALVACLTVSQGFAQSRDRDSESDDDAAEKTLDPRVAEDLLEAYELMEEEAYEEGLARLDRLMDRRGTGMKPFDRASVLQVRGSAHVNVEDMRGALDDFLAALRLNALPTDQQNRLRFNVAQLYFVNEEFEEAIRFFEEWMSGDVEVTHTTYFMLAASHYNLDDYAAAVEPIETAIELVPEPEKRYYDLLNILYSNLERNEERTELLARMVEIWPEELNYWRQLSSLYLEQGDRFRSFATLETAYVNGLIEDEEGIILLAQYYSTFDNPHRGAELIEKEMEAGNVERNVDNLELLSQLWSQAREHTRAIPVLREAAELSDVGQLSYRLGQSLLANEQNAEAEAALEAALEKGGLEDSNTADAWMLLGNARFNQAEPGDQAQRNEADEAFARAQRFGSTRRQASDWRQYISAINQTESRQAALEREQSEDLAVAAQERLLTSCRAQQLAGSQLSEQCRDLLAETDGEGANNR
jgi:tetratricopeptide (TPR) repeat protein